MLPWYKPQVQTWHPCPSVQTKVLFWGRKNALERWIISCWFLLPACLCILQHSLHKTFARAQQARLSSEALGSKKPQSSHLCLISEETSVTQANPYRFSESGPKTYLLLLSPSTPFQDLSNITFFGERAQIRSEQISMLSLSGQSSFKATLAHSILQVFFFKKVSVLPCCKTSPPLKTAEVLHAL